MISTIHEAKTNLSKLIQKALAGEEVIIANRNTPVVKLVAIEAAEKPKRKMGTGKHLIIKMDDSFDDPVDELFEDYYPDIEGSIKVAEDEAPYNSKKL